MDSVNKEVTQVRNSILGFVVNLQISRQLSSMGMSCFPCFSTFSLFLKFEIIFFRMTSSTRFAGFKQ